MTKEYMPKFNNLEIESFPKKLANLLQANLIQIDEILLSFALESSQTLVSNVSHVEVKTQRAVTPTWDNLMYPLDVMSDEVERLWSPLAHLHAVVNTPVLRKCYQQCLPILAAYDSKIGQNQNLYAALLRIDRKQLSAVQNKILDDAIRDFKLAGVGLDEKQKKLFENAQTKLAELTNKFENNILDAVQDFSLHITNHEQVRGLPEHLLASAKQSAEDKSLSGWLFNLEQPTFIGVITYAEDRELRQKFYEAYTTRASDVGPAAGKFDNTQIMNQILELRQEIADLLGYANYAEVSLATKMAESVNEVNKFLQDLANIAYPKAQVEFKSLEQFAQENLALSALMPWDVAYVSEKMLHAKYAISQEKLRPYFPLSQVLSGLFEIIRRLYGVNLAKIAEVDVWHKDVECFAVMSDKNAICGYLYLDLFARENKRSGAWMDSLQSRYVRADGSVQLPIATLTCNFAKAAPGKPAILAHDEVETLFHEFGHCLHHVLTKVDYLSASGVNGVEWDAVELPSQFFENWCWDKEALQLLTKHVDTQQKLPDDIYTNLINSKNFLSAMSLVRQLEFAIFDFRIHEQYVRSDPDFVMRTLAKVRQEVSVLPIVNYNRFQNSFSHIFAGGYAAGYYSYKWAEVLSADAFAKFQEHGIFNAKTGSEFLRCILEVGGSKKAQIAFENFRGRPPKVDALLRQTGII